MASYRSYYGSFPENPRIVTKERDSCNPQPPLVISIFPEVSRLTPFGEPILGGAIGLEHPSKTGKSSGDQELTRAIPEREVTALTQPECQLGCL